MEYSIGAYDTKEYPLLICLFELFARISVEEWEAYQTDDPFSPEVLEFSHCNKQRSSGTDHIVGHEYCLAFYIAQKTDAPDIRTSRIFAHHGVISLLVEHGQWSMECLCIELVPLNCSRIRAHYNKIGIAEIDDLVQLDQRLITCMQILKVGMVKAVFDLAGVDIEGNDPFDSHILAHSSEHCSRECFSTTFLVLPCIWIGGKHERDALHTGILQRIDRGEEEHEVIVYRDRYRFIRPGDLDRVLICHIVDDEHAQTTNSLKNLSFDFSIGKPGIFYWGFEIGTGIRLRLPPPWNLLADHIVVECLDI